MAYHDPSPQVTALLSRLTALLAAPPAKPAVHGPAATRADDAALTSKLAANHRVGPSRPWKLYDRLTPDDIKAIVHDYELGTTQKNLAIRFNISVSSVQRVLRDHGRER